MRIKRSTYDQCLQSGCFVTETTEKTEASKTDEAKDESEKKEDTSKVEVLEDGTYSAEFDTDSSHVSCK